MPAGITAATGTSPFLTNAAAEGARVASLPGYNQADVQARVAAYAAASNITGVNATAVGATIAGPGGTSWPGSQVTVTLSAGPDTSGND